MQQRFSVFALFGEEKSWGCQFLFLHNQLDVENVISLMKKSVVTFVTKKMRWWVAFDFDQVNWKNNFALYLILSFRQKFGLFLKQCELSKKDETFNPQLKSAVLDIYAFTTLKSNILRYRFWDTTKCYTCLCERQVF